MRKSTVGSYFSSKYSITDKLKTFTSLNQLNIYITNYGHNIQPLTVIKTRQLSDRTCLILGQQQQWDVVPPYQLLESTQTATSQDPRACSWSPWLRTSGASNKILVQWLSTNSTLSSKILQLNSCIRSFSAVYPSNTFQKFPSQWNPLKYIHLNDSPIGMSSLNSLQWAFLLRLPRSFLG